MGKAEAIPEGEERASLEDPQVPISSSQILDIFGLSAMSSTGVNVTIDKALGVPAIWSAVNFISGTIAGLPLSVYKKSKTGRSKMKTRLARILHDNVNEEMTSFDWRKQVFERVLTEGRSYTLIVRGTSEPVRFLWPLEKSAVKVKRRATGEKVYEVKQGKDTKEYPAKDIIDVSFMLKSDGISHYSPIRSNKNAIGLAISATEYGSRFFQNGGVPPFMLIGNFQSPGAINRASRDLEDAIKSAMKEARQALPIPKDHELKTLGVDPEKSQLVPLQKWLIEEFARIYQLPPVFLQDLSHGTFSNTEQQDLHFVKHTIKRWVEQFEQELNLKLFGWDKNDRYVELNMDGLLRGDFKTRMEGYASAIQNSVLKPNEVRGKENLPDDPEGDVLLIQGATVPLGSQPTGGNNDAEED